LFSDLTIIAETPIINLSLQKPENLSDDGFQIIKWHFEDLNLIQQYKERCNSTLSTELKIIKDSSNNGLSNQQIITQLKTSESNYADDYGLNYWKSTMFQCMSQNVDELLAL
ncbi:MAG: hypothetical protein WA775_16290, partial [Psychroserpens sp.]|uniref:hypothetical protein n=1 Tax=Psychroserpens sp. TaxID=2020870 RepID=UPI003CA6E6CC